MAAPGTAYDDPVIGKDPQPADMAHYVDTTDDNGGVHINSGIPNRAFYLAATAIGGYRLGEGGQRSGTSRCATGCGRTPISRPRPTLTVAVGRRAVRRARRGREGRGRRLDRGRGTLGGDMRVRLERSGGVREHPPDVHRGRGGARRRNAPTSCAG